MIHFDSSLQAKLTLMTNNSDEIINVLLVDDDPALLEALTDALELRIPDITVEPYDAAPAALGRLNEATFDLLISDVKMPGMDGLELLSEALKIAPAMPVVLITGHGDTDIAIKALRSGAFDLIQKPLDREYVAAAVNRAVETVQLRKEVADLPLTFTNFRD